MSANSTTRATFISIIYGNIRVRFDDYHTSCNRILSHRYSYQKVVDTRKHAIWPGLVAEGAVERLAVVKDFDPLEDDKARALAHLSPATFDNTLLRYLGQPKNKLFCCVDDCAKGKFRTPVPVK